MSTPINISDQYDQLSGDELIQFENKLLQDYLDNKMTKDGREWFENILLDKFIEHEWDEDQSDQIRNLLEKDESLKFKYQSWTDAGELLEKQTQREKIKRLVTTQLLTTETPQEKKTSVIDLFTRNKNRIILLAASVVILIGVGISIWLNTKPLSTDNLYAMYYEPYKLDFEITRDSLPANEFTIKAQKAFLNGDSENTISYLKQSIDVEPNNWQLYLNLGSVYMATEQFEKAIPLYKKVSDENRYLYETGQWYLGLCYLKTGYKEKALETFNKLYKSGKYYTEKVTDILNKINY